MSVTKQKIYKQISNPFSYTPEHAIMAYKSSESYKINDVLRNNHRLTQQQESIVKSLDKYLDDLPDVKEPTYRALMLKPETLKKVIETHQEGNIVNYKAYTSTSKNPNDYAVSGATNVLFGINGKHGKDVSNIGIQSENEVLFKRNSKFKVGQTLNKNGVFYAQLDEID